MDQNRPHATVATIVERNQKYLLVREQRDGKIVYNQPAGHIENGESVVQAAIRETLEETGWNILPTRFAGLSTYHAPNGISYLRSTLIAEPLSQVADAPLDEGILEAVWLDYEEILMIEDQLRSPIVKKVIDDYRMGISYPLDILYEQSPIR
ncbi:NUDIX hydrolase [Aestuariicella hydrocarbonica]|uniref:Phosphatase NudJ n=2 Tax=Pseudomaricurvus hydrocarbonicus TaxID=1470433 RepID=A0A9E5JTM2_9GAMM|nr:NUDIX hydrolase [Aestuariicella hydrocarbonica]